METTRKTTRIGKAEKIGLTVYAVAMIGLGWLYYAKNYTDYAILTWLLTAAPFTLLLLLKDKDEDDDDREKKGGEQ